jgi:hypothetical protein
MGGLEEMRAEALEFISELTPKAFGRLTESMDRGSAAKTGGLRTDYDRPAS